MLFSAYVILLRGITSQYILNDVDTAFEILVAGDLETCLLACTALKGCFSLLQLWSSWT